MNPVMNKKSNFFDAVYKIVQRIPPGRVTTYGAIAHCLGAPGSARMVGWALNQAIHRSDIPAHRVLNRYGLLTGKHHFVGALSMEQQLAEEGIQVCANRVKEFTQLFWDPSQISEQLDSGLRNDSD